MVVPERRTQAVRTAESHRRLVDAAIKLLAERGYASTTLVEIGRTAELSRGLVTYHFATKEACMEAVIVTIGDRLHEMILPVVDGARGLAALDGIIDVYFDQLGSEDAALRAMYTVLIEAVSAAPGLRAATAEINQSFRDLVAGLVVQAIEDGDVSGQVLPEVCAILIEGIVRGVATQWLISASLVDLEVVVPVLKRAIRRSITGPGTGQEARESQRRVI